MYNFIMCCCVPICFFSTRIVILDDDQNWLSAISLLFKDENSVKISADPDEVIKSMLDNEKNIAKLGEYDLNDILKDDSRKNIISVIIADFIMPKYDGAHLFNILGDISAKKILVSAFMDYDTMYAIKKTYSMDAFLSKNMAMFTNKLGNILNSVKYKFFVSLSTTYLESRKDLKDLLSDKNFYELFDKIISENSISEFYLVDDTGSYVLKAEDGELYELVLMKKDFIAEKNKLYAEILDRKVPNMIFMHPGMLQQSVCTKAEIAGYDSIFFEAQEIIINNDLYYYSFHNGCFFFKDFRV